MTTTFEHDPFRRDQGADASTGVIIAPAKRYPGGLAGFAAHVWEPAGRYGERFEPPASLLARAGSGEVDR
jgi:3-hydroxyacyl-CoA dehydrogenase / enoyl-CoA hydratase / 3-hydroxybutyryl-CoA epimerase